MPAGRNLEAAILGASEVALFDNLYLAYAGDARRIARAILRDSELAADAVHTGFLEMLRYVLGGRRWADPGDARSMVLRNVRWAALNIQRSRHRLGFGAQAASGTPSDDVMWARAETQALCEQIVGQLQPQHQETLRLRYVDGLSNVEAAARLGVSTGVVESRLHRALAAARRAAHRVGVAPDGSAVGSAPRRESEGGGQP
jgi:RNA polymerase sigma-70 factor (ECF subfamily)